MSFILDALKKSEVERQRQNVPGLMDAGAAPRRPRFPMWAIALTALLAVNLTVLIIVLARGGWPSLSVRSTAGTHVAAPPAPAAAASSTPAQGPASTAAPPLTASSAAPPPISATATPSVPRQGAGAASSAADQHFSPRDAAPPVYAPEIPPDNVAPPSGASGTSGHSGSAAAAPRGREPLLTSSADKADEEVLPTLSELDLTGANALPELHLDVHVYATKPAERFVYINMRKYQEGNTLAEGPVLERIRRDGVVLDYRGLRFLLPRQ